MSDPTASQQQAQQGEQRSLWRALARLGPYTEGLRLRWALGLLSAVGAGVTALAIPQMLGTVVDDVEAEGAAARAVWFGAGFILALGIFEALLVYLRRFFVIPVASDAETSMRTSLFARLAGQSAAFHSAWDAGQLQSRAIADLNLLRRFFAFGSLMLVTVVVTLITGLTLMFLNSPVMAAIFLCGAVPVLLFGPWFRRRFSQLSRSSQDQAGDVATHVEESVHGIRVLKAFGRGRYAQASFREQARRLRILEVTKAKTLATFQLLMILLPEGVLAICLAGGIWQVSEGNATAGAITSFFGVAIVLKAPLENIGQLLSMVFMAKTGLDRHIDVMDIQPELTSPQQPRTAPERGVVELEDVRFRFPDAKPGEPDLLDGVSLRVEPGETLALVSATGGGTSTLLSLIPRLYDVTGGAVRVDGVDVRDFDLADLRSRATIAFEEPTLFSASVRANVLLGTGHQRDGDDPHHPDRDAFPADDELQQVMEDALATADAGFVESLPDGVDTRIGEEGLSLSGGQRQRLALARAIASRPSVLLLDDPLSALDVGTEERVTERLKEALEGTTTIIVAHRPSTVALADRAALLHREPGQGARIAEVGTHAELLARSELYRTVMAPEREVLR
ncbi:ABC transporter ATP-binding protein [Nesterenkonia populi]|uniref:ABC transporter ATP-binding protein n=1 Tax=Nesterenkonia populi TaxID=1591087 RepID=UPI0011BE4CB9|nr:ABC transporter ATP-binding protein [Nesterenkonia populi]